MSKSEVNRYLASLEGRYQGNGYVGGGRLGGGVHEGGAQSRRRRHRTMTERASAHRRAQKNPWIAFIKAYASQYGISYMAALADPRAKCLYYERKKK